MVEESSSYPQQPAAGQQGPHARLGHGNEGDVVQQQGIRIPWQIKRGKAQVYFATGISRDVGAKRRRDWTQLLNLGKYRQSLAINKYPKVVLNGWRKCAHGGVKLKDGGVSGNPARLRQARGNGQDRERTGSRFQKDGEPAIQHREKCP